ncbi:TRL domain-containing protein [Leptospira idonii]|uniref:TRL-like family protein n=1 Tax=Leptospira idonii TaxID=1193500 RepID=A0A4R9M179_9LEPT|nr:TRL domain-containing protein [Leptospira idonii]TGN18999.1 hypothetical protein EHS15_11350 [Leptospira idonii]
MNANVKKIIGRLSLLILPFLFTACVTNPIPLALYGNYKGTLHVFPEKIGTKSGRTCYTQFGAGYLPLFLVGDGSVKTAADNGGITKISLVEYEQENIVTGIYARTCIIAYGE